MSSESTLTVTSPLLTTSSLPVSPLLNTTSMDTTTEFPENILQILNDEKATLYIPVIVYMIILIIVGIAGNILVCCVYCNKQTKTSSHFFIMALAILDLLTCAIGMPTEIADLRYPYMFYASAACKLLRFVESVTTIGSSIVLIAVAVDRYLRICKLGRQLKVQTAKCLCVGAMIVGVLLSWPTFFLFGHETVYVTEEIRGVDCSTDDSVKRTVYPTLYYGFLFLLFIGCTVFFAVIYCNIGFQIWKQKKAKIGQGLDTSNTQKRRSRAFSNSSTKHTDVDDQTTDPCDRSTDPISTDASSDDVITHKKTLKDRRISSISQTSMKTAKKRQIKVTRTTIVLFAVTVAYIVSYLPFLVVMVVRNIKKDFEDNLGPEAEVAYKFCVKSYFINNAINPLIYSFLNVNFRKDAKKFLSRCCGTCCLCCRQSEL